MIVGYSWLSAAYGCDLHLMARRIEDDSSMTQRLVPAGTSSSLDAGLPDAQASLPDPVFVICHARSGSTLVRFLLDAHPELSCPPETNLPVLCSQLATVWSLIEGAPLSPKRDDAPPEIPAPAINGVRATVDSMLGPYLVRRGKRRYCDKSLGTARFARLLRRVYPNTRFICLYRHPMDVIASGIEACPWGLSGYGFDAYSASAPGNAVLALAQFWVDNATAITAVEEEFPEASLRVRYEDLVADAEGTAGRIFGFLDAAPVPGISAACFSADRDYFGPGDHKIWCTSRISADSVGRGWAVPSAMLPPQAIAEVNSLAEKLGYLPVDGGWGSSEAPADLRVSVTDRDVGDAAGAYAPAAAVSLRSGELRDRLQAGLTAISASTAARWASHAAESMVAVWLPDDAKDRAEYWLVDFMARTVTTTSRGAQESSDWDVVGSADAWQRILAGKLNLSVAFRACRLRYCDGEESSPLARDARIRILADLMRTANGGGVYR
jgi:hypothetical protein